MLSNSGKFRDRNPDTIPAGKLFSGSDTTKDCIKNPQRPRTPEQVHKFRCTTQSAPGKTRIFYGRYSDPDISSLLSHGVSTKPSLVAGQLVNPSPQSYFKYRLNEKREEGVYASRQRAPLGQSHDQKKGLPAEMGPYDQRFGIPIIKDTSAGELVNPCKSHEQVIEEGHKGLDLYKKSHSAYTVGESYNRKYDWSRVPETSSFGIETPHDNRGLNTKKTLKWLHETMSEKAAHITSKRVDDFRERQLPQVGVVHDPIKDTLNVDKDHMFGIMVKPDEYSAGDLIHMSNAKNSLRGKDRERGVLAAIRQHLKNGNYQNFADLKQAFAFYDKDKSGTIDMNELMGVCRQFHLPVQHQLLEMLLESVDLNKNNTIDYVEFVNFLNWKDSTPTGLQKKQEGEYKEKTLEEATSSGISLNEDGQIDTNVLKKQIDSAPSNFVTSSSMYNGAVINELVKGSRKYGIPTIRSDLPAPRIRRIADNTNYGDESDSYGIISPSVYSNHGVYEEDFFKARQQGDVRRICDSIGVEMTNEIFQEIWKSAREATTCGEVSVESFRNVLDERIAEEFQKMSCQEQNSNNLRDAITKMTNKKPAIYETFNKTKNKEILSA